MKSAFEILDVPETADDAAIKSAYLAKVRQYPPEHAPEEFQRIRRAYELINNARNRAAYRLFHCEVLNWEELAEFFCAGDSSVRPSVKTTSKVLLETLSSYKLPIA